MWNFCLPMINCIAKRWSKNNQRRRTTYVMKPEYLMAIALRTGRPKDFIRLSQFIEAKAYDAKILTEILAGNGLMDKWTRFNDSYMKGLA